MRKIKYPFCLRSLSAALSLSSLLLLSACGTAQEPPEASARPIPSAAVQTEAPAETPAAPERSQVPEISTAPTVLPEASLQPEEIPQPPAAPITYTDLAGLDFYCSTGVGAWSDGITLSADGSFSGQFHDMDMGGSGDGHPNGTIYLSEYAGQFSPLEPVSAYEYRFTLKKMTENTPESSEIKDGILYRYVPAEITEGDTFTLYLPGTPRASLPEGIDIWLNYGDRDSEFLTGYVIYDGDRAFVTGTIEEESAPSVPDMMTAAEQEDARLRDAVNSGELVSQAELNQNAQARYECWDDLLNELWAMLKEALPPDEMDKLLTEQRAWLREKEKAVEESGKEVEGGSLYPLVTADTAADLTRERCYVLASFLQ